LLPTLKGNNLSIAWDITISRCPKQALKPTDSEKQRQIQARNKRPIRQRGLAKIHLCIAIKLKSTIYRNLESSF